MSQRIIGALMTFGFAAISLLGHGGLHALPGGDACHGSHLSATATGAHEHSASHSHSGCCGHHTEHCHSPADGHEHHPHAPVPHEHDHDDCLICQWHAQGQFTAVDVVVPLCDGCTPTTVSAAPQVAESYRLTTLFTRGPPTA